MSIVKGTGGSLSAAANLLPTGDLTVALWFKLANPGDYATIFEHGNTSTHYTRSEVVNDTFKFSVVQRYASSVSGSVAHTAGTWEFMLGSQASSDSKPRLTTDSESVIAPGISGAYQTPASPTLKIFGRPDNTYLPDDGTKLGMIAIWGSKLDSTDEAHLVAGGDPTDLPSGKAMSEYWIDSAGVSQDGSSNLVSWTGSGGTVLSPTGTITVDDADLAPVVPAFALTASPAVTPTVGTSLTVSGVAASVTATGLTLSDGTAAVAQTITSQTHDGVDTLTVNFTGVLGNLPFGTGRTLEATLSDESTVSGTTELVTIADNAAVDVVDPVTTENSVYHEATSPNADTPETGDQIEHTDSGNTTVAADGTITQTEVRNFEARFWSVTDRTWGSFETISPFDVDATPATIATKIRALKARAPRVRALTATAPEAR